MTVREKEIFSMIKSNPMISQQELADKLGLKRSSVAVHILNLTRKGLIRGKGYILNEAEYTLVIGGANIDILGAPGAALVKNDSNPGKVKTSLGGVGRNIAENLCNLNVNTRFISAVGNDEGGKRILEEGSRTGLDMSGVSVFNGESTSTYLSILDQKGDMYIAISDMDIMRKIDAEYLKKQSELIKGAAVVVFDTNLDEDVIKYLLTGYEDVKFFADTVSTAKTVKLKTNLEYLNCIKPNKKEAEILTGLTIENDADFFRALQVLIDKGIERVFITAGSEGVYYGDSQQSGHFRMAADDIINANGAGDMFMAAVVYCYINDYPVDYTARFASCASIMSMRSINTINSDLNVKKIEQELEKYERYRSEQ